MRAFRNLGLLLTCGVLISLQATAAWAQPRGRGPRPAGGPGERPAASNEPTSDIKPYDEVVTKDAVSKPGLFLTHQVGDKLY